MRDLRDYSVKDWSRLRPPLHAYKSAIYRTETAVYVRRRADGAEALVARARARNRPAVAISIAYEAPWVIELQIAAAQRHFTDAELVVCDNSKSDDAAHEIAELCRAGQIDYLRLPHNPKKTGSRSHALAINWAYRNLICEVKPTCFAFLDHDLIPTSAIEFASLVAHQPFYGHVRTAGHRWFLWAGYCVFDRRY
ncbi:MAG: hypothetical protein HKN60_09085, partial [Rhizobiales bacterium]|nr:hypothetical protein [Hyphomicrobiales bacterium]